uniref:UBC core domain-containing protein n=1 Tax=Romanomermis culicivorax TaxID=13658 RepID=A0A915KZK7_ROMCU
MIFVADLESVYISRLKDLQFRTCSFKSYQCGWRHHYWTNDKPKFAKEVVTIFKEWTALKSSLPISSSTSIFVLCISTYYLFSRPDDTPYANGCFLFDILFPETYPLVPPKVNLLTTGGCRVRFNPNLYNTGKVCLSLLGTWSGEQGEKWNSRSSTILQVLVSIQSLIFHEQPYFNEPGYEKLIGTEKGVKASNDYNKEVRRNCVSIAILDVLTNPPPDFEDVIKLHFSLKKEKVTQVRAYK